MDEVPALDRGLVIMVIEHLRILRGRPMRTRSRTCEPAGVSGSILTRFALGLCRVGDQAAKHPVSKDAFFSTGVEINGMTWPTVPH